MAPPVVEISYKEVTFKFELLEQCSVSDHLRAKGEFYELEFLESLSRILDPACVVLDVGAHIGNHTVFLAGVVGLRVVAYEPNPEAFELLQRNVALNGLQDKVTCVPLALSDRSGELSMAPTVEADAGTMAITGEDRPENSIRVRTSTLDEVELPDAPQIFVKLDVEGHEPAVINGGRRFIEERRPDISVEMQSLDHFDEMSDLLGDDYEPRDVFNPTPTVLFRSRGASIPRSFQHHLVRYAIRNAIDYGQRRDWYVAERKRAERLSERNDRLEEFLDSLAELLNAPRPKQSDLREGDLGQLVSDVAAKALDRQQQAVILEALVPWLVETQDAGWAGWIAELRTRGPEFDGSGIRCLILRIGDVPIPASLVSILTGPVDIVDCEIEFGEVSGRPVRFRRFVDGECVVDLREAFGEGSLGAARVSLIVEDGDAEYGPLGAAAFVGGGSAPSLEDAFRSLIDCPYVVICHDASYKFSRLGVLTGASRVFLSDPDQMGDWSRAQIVPAQAMDGSPVSLASELIEASRDTPRSYEKPASVPADVSSRVLLVSYYAPPATPVSVQRLAYWQDDLPAIASDDGKGMEVAWLTATYRAHDRPASIVVPDRGPYRLSEHWFERYQDAKELGLDSMGITWSHYVEEAIDDLSGPYTTVILSGNPFHYFALGEVFRRAWGSNIVLDFRDPFAYNPRFKFTAEQREYAIELESKWVEEADAVVSVNDYCLDTVAPRVEVSRHVVANGFDEAVVEAANPGMPRETFNPPRIAYSGTVFSNLPLDGVLDAIPAGRFEVHHFGRDYSASRGIESYPAGVVRGLVSYRDLIPALKECVAGIIMTSGEPSTQTTKLFDYVACDLDIIIVTSARPRTGNLHDMTKDLEGVFWVRNKERDLRRFFQRYEPTFVTRPERERFSRRHQTRRLYELITDLETSA